MDIIKLYPLLTNMKFMKELLFNTPKPTLWYNDPQQVVFKWRITVGNDTGGTYGYRYGYSSNGFNQGERYGSISNLGANLAITDLIVGYQVPNPCVWSNGSTTAIMYSYSQYLTFGSRIPSNKYLQFPYVVFDSNMNNLSSNGPNDDTQYLMSRYNYGFSGTQEVSLSKGKTTLKRLLVAGEQLIMYLGIPYIS